jgi:hypothetical protein
LVAAKGAASRPNPERRPAAQVTGCDDDALSDYSGPALGVALLVGLGLGLVVSLRQ